MGHSGHVCMWVARLASKPLAAPAAAWLVLRAAAAGVAMRVSSCPVAWRAAAGLERRVLGQGLVTAPSRGRKAVTAVLSAAHHLGLHGKGPGEKTLRQDRRQAGRRLLTERKVLSPPRELREVTAAEHEDGPNH